MAVRLSSVDDLKVLLRVPAADTTLDARLGTIVEEISAECESWTGRSYTYQGYANEPYRGGVGIVVLRQRPVDSTAALQVKSVTSTTTVIYDPTDYSVDYVRGIIRLRGGLLFSAGPDGAQVTYSAGYASTGTGTAQKITVPGDLSRAVRKLAGATYYHEAGIIDQKALQEIRDDVRKIWSAYMF